MLELQNLESGYGKKQVIFGLSLAIKKGEIVALIGPNGAGKSTVLKTICGLVPAWSGKILFDGALLAQSSPAKNVSKGILYAPQGNRVFQDLTVMENLEVGGYLLPRNEVAKRIAEILAIFPTLKDHLKQEAGNLSGGEQQLVSLARILIQKPKLLLLDEPSLGLSPGLVKFTFDKIAEVSRDLGISVLIVEQKVGEVLQICDRVNSLKLGRIAFTGAPQELTQNQTLLKSLFI